MNTGSAIARLGIILVLISRRNISSVISLSETESKHGGRFFKKYGMCKFCDTLSEPVKDERLVVTALLLPFCNGVGA